VIRPLCGSRRRSSWEFSLEPLRTAEHDEQQSNEKTGKLNDPGHGHSQAAMSEICLCDENLYVAQIITST